jgi:hypothetical protein
MGMFKGNSVHKFSKKKFWCTSLLSPESYAYHNYFNPADLITVLFFFQYFTKCHLSVLVLSWMECETNTLVR